MSYRHHSGRESRQCAHCNNTYQAELSDAWDKRRYCSRQCQADQICSWLDPKKRGKLRPCGSTDSFVFVHEIA